MYTLYALPKGFIGHAGVIQRNAIESWTRLEPRPEIILFGTDPGTSEIAQELGLKHCPDLNCSALGTPLVDDLFRRAEAISSNPYLCYCNADIILLSDFSRAVEAVQSKFEKFLMISERWNVDITTPLDFSSADWEARVLQNLEHIYGSSKICATDFFFYSRGAFGEIPPFAIGRTVWDNYLIYAARNNGLPVVDATSVVKAVHQNHDYGHVKGASQTMVNDRQVAATQEGRMNVGFMPPGAQRVNILDANCLLTEAGVVPARTALHWRQSLRTGGAYHPRLAPVYALADRLVSLLWAVLSPRRPAGI